MLSRYTRYFFFFDNCSFEATTAVGSYFLVVCVSVDEFADAQNYDFINHILAGFCISAWLLGDMYVISSMM